MDFTFVCPTEIIAFSNRIDEFRRIGAEVRQSPALLSSPVGWLHKLLVSRI